MNIKEEYSEEVDRLRRNRVKVSYYKYGSAKENFGKKYVDAIKSHDMCIKKYQETKNKEYILDAMNYLMFEYMYPHMEGVFFRATESSESAGIYGLSVEEAKRIRNGENNG